MRILALDLGTQTGWAALYDDERILSGTLNFKPQRGESAGMLFVRFRAWLNEMLYDIKPALVIYEQPLCTFPLAARVGMGMAGHLEEICTTWREKTRGKFDFSGREIPLIEYCHVPCSKLKKFATGGGRASKAAMLAAALDRWPDQVIENDDQADALWLLAYGQKHYCSGGVP